MHVEETIAGTESAQIPQQRGESLRDAAAFDFDRLHGRASRIFSLGALAAAVALWFRP